jgi:MFS family permease
LSVEASSGKLWNLGFVHLLAINILNASAFGIITPITPGYMVSMGATLAFAGMIVGVFSISALFARPLGGVLGDKLNKKWIIFAAMTLTGIMVITYALVPDVIWLLPIRILHGFFFSISGTVAFALGAEFIPRGRLGEGIGYLGIGHIVGMAFGPNIAIFLLEHFPYEVCFIISGIVMVCVGLSVAAIRYSQPPPGLADNSVKKGFRLSDFISVQLFPMACFAAVFAISIALKNSYIVMFGDERAISGIGLLFITNAVVQVLSRPFSGKLADRRGVAYVVIPGFILVSVSMAIISLSHALWPILIAGVLMALGYGGALPSLQASCLKKLGSRRAAVATGTYFIGFDVGMSIGQISGGVFIDSLGFSAAFGIAGAITFAGLCFYLIYHRYENRGEESKWLK